MRTKIEKVARSRSPDLLEELADNDKFNASRLIRTEVNYFYSKTKLDN